MGYRKYFGRFEDPQNQLRGHRRKGSAQKGHNREKSDLSRFRDPWSRGIIDRWPIHVSNWQSRPTGRPFSGAGTAIAGNRKQRPSDSAIEVHWRQLIAELLLWATGRGKTMVRLKNGGDLHKNVENWIYPSGPEMREIGLIKQY